MTRHRFSTAELEAYLDEALAPAEMVQIENALRDQPELASALATVGSRRDAGVHSLGEIWRRHRLSCPTREQLGSFLLGAMDDQAAGFIRFHVQRVGCRYCQANLADLQARQREQPAEVDSRRRKYFQSSAGHLRRGS